jgi:hypothetical protein
MEEKEKIFGRKKGKQSKRRLSSLIFGQKER